MLSYELDLQIDKSIKPFFISYSMNKLSIISIFFITLTIIINPLINANGVSGQFVIEDNSVQNNTTIQGNITQDNTDQNESAITGNVVNKDVSQSNSIFSYIKSLIKKFINLF